MNTIFDNVAPDASSLAMRRKLFEDTDLRSQLWSWLPRIGFIHLSERPNFGSDG